MRLLVPALLALLVFSPALRTGFSGDDITIQLWQVPEFRTVGDAFAPPPDVGGWSPQYYRPVVTLLYMAEDRLSSLLAGRPVPPTGVDERLDPYRARIPHGVNVAGHALATLLVTLLTLRLLRGSERPERGALAEGLLFAFHPMQALVVCPISGHSDLFAALFLAAALLLALRARDGRSPPCLAGAALFFLLALLSKEVALAGLFLLPLALWATAGKERRSARDPYGWAGQTALAAGVVAVYLLLRGLSGSKMNSAAQFLPATGEDFGARARSPSTSKTPPSPGRCASTPPKPRARRPRRRRGCWPSARSAWGCARRAGAGGSRSTG